MAEVGLLPFALVALQAATQVLPPYRTRFSKHQFTQPQLLAVLWATKTGLFANPRYACESTIVKSGSFLRRTSYL